MCTHGDIVALELGGKLADIDRCIVPIISALNAAGIATVASCCGHGHRPGWIALANGLQLAIHKDLDDLKRTAHLWPDIHGRWPGEDDRPLLDIPEFLKRQHN